MIDLRCNDAQRLSHPKYCQMQHFQQKKKSRCSIFFSFIHAICVAPLQQNHLAFVRNQLQFENIADCDFHIDLPMIIFFIPFTMTKSPHNRYASSTINHVHHKFCARFFYCKSTQIDRLTKTKRYAFHVPVAKDHHRMKKKQQQQTMIDDNNL